MTEPIGCREAVRRLWEYLDGGLPDPDHHAVEQHLAFCLRCCGELAFARELQEALQAKTAPDLPPALEDRLMGVLERADTGEGGADDATETPRGGT